MAVDLSVYDKFGKGQDTIGYLQGIEKNQQNLKAGETSQRANDIKVQVQKLDILKELAGGMKTQEDIPRVKSFAASMGVDPELLSKLPDDIETLTPLRDAFIANSDATKNQLVNELNMMKFSQTAQQNDFMNQMRMNEDARKQAEFERNSKPQYTTNFTNQPQEPQGQMIDTGNGDEPAFADGNTVGVLYNNVGDAPPSEIPDSPVYDKDGMPVVKGGREVYQKATGERYLKDKPLQQKPLSPTITKMQNEALDEISIASRLKADLEPFKKLLVDGGLDLGPIENLSSTARNKAGISNPNSRNYANLRNSITGIRNNLLRLNKGTQTEGDAIRAMEEILDNFNDADYVTSRLATFIADTERRSNALQNQTNQMRSEYGQPELDFTPYINQPSASQVENGKTKPTPKQSDDGWSIEEVK